QAAQAAHPPSWNRTSPPARAAPQPAARASARAREPPALPMATAPREPSRRPSSYICFPCRIRSFIWAYLLFFREYTRDKQALFLFLIERRQGLQLPSEFLGGPLGGEHLHAVPQAEQPAPEGGADHQIQGDGEELFAV